MGVETSRAGSNAAGAASSDTAADLVLYDGDCGLCHGAVKRLLVWDKDGSRFLYAPLAGETAALRLADLGSLPDSIVVLDPKGGHHTEFAAVRRVLTRLGEGGTWYWGLLAACARLTPRFLGNLGYRFVARIRRRLFAPPTGACPLVPKDQARRFRP